MYSEATLSDVRASAILIPPAGGRQTALPAVTANSSEANLRGAAGVENPRQYECLRGGFDEFKRAEWSLGTPGLVRT